MMPDEVPFSGFTCCCDRVSGVSGARPFSADLVARSEEAVYRLHYSPDCKVIGSGPLTAVIAGQLMKGLGPESILPLYRKYGTAMGSHLSGFYAILILDQQLGKAVIISDRVSSVPLYSVHHSGGWIVSTSFMHLSSLMPGEPEPDAAGIAWYMTNGVIHNNRTLLKNVYRLNHATLYEGDAKAFTAHEFWRFHFLDDPLPFDEQKLRDTLKEVMVAAVEDCIRPGGPLYLSLSGGHDSSGILAVLTRLAGRKEVSTYSYVYGECHPASDPWTAREIAAAAGCPHELIPSYAGDFLNNIEFNILWGDGISNFCDEIICWQHYREFFPAYRTLCLFGDNIFADGRYSDLHTPTEALESILIKDLSFMPWLEGYLPAEQWKSWKSLLKEEYMILMDRSARVSKSLRDQVNYLVLEGRARNAHIPWRANFCSQAFMPANPLYHDDCLDLQMKLPEAARKEKSLFIRTVEELAPDFYRGDRPRTMGYVPDWKNEIRLNLAQVDHYLRMPTAYGLDALIPGDCIRNLLAGEIVSMPVRKKPGLYTRFLRQLMMKKKTTGHPPSMKKIQGPERVVLRYLVLSGTLRKIKEMRGE